MSNTIPGATSTLGWGFNVFGAYAESSKLRQLLDLTKDGYHNKTVNGVEYQVPNTVSVGDNHTFSGSASFLTSKEEITKYFSSKAKVSAGFAGFKGSLEAGFTLEQLNSSEFNYCIYDGHKLAYPLNINNPSGSLIAESVLQDPDYQSMLLAAENGFDRENPADFYRFFLKYGTHFVHELEMGGSLYYYGAVNKQYSSSSQKIAGKVSLEYQGLFSAGGKAEADWKSVGKEWVENREMQLKVVGGDVNFPTTANASYGTNMNEQYNKWINAVDSSPSPMGFRLLPISDLFSGKIAESISEALEFFIASEIYIGVDREYITLAINGLPIDTSSYQPIVKNGLVTHMFSYLAIVVDRESGMVVDSVSVLGESGWSYLYDEKEAPNASKLPDSLKKYEGKQRYLLIFMWYGEDDSYSQTYVSVAPEPPLRTLLITAGAGAILEDWKNQEIIPGAYTKVSYNVYVLVGVFGLQGEGIETMQTTSLTDVPASSRTNIAFTPKLVGGSIMFTPSQLA